jgi:hypothetical protein
MGSNHSESPSLNYFCLFYLIPSKKHQTFITLHILNHTPNSINIHNIHTNSNTQKKAQNLWTQQQWNAFTHPSHNQFHDHRSLYKAQSKILKLPSTHTFVKTKSWICLKVPDQYRFHSHNKLNFAHHSITIQLIHANGINTSKFLTPYGSSSCPNASKEHLTLLLISNFKSFTQQKEKEKTYNHILANSNLHILLLSIQQPRQPLLIYSLSLLCTPKSSSSTSSHSMQNDILLKLLKNIEKLILKSTQPQTRAYPKHCTYHNWNLLHSSTLLLLSMMKNKKDGKLYQHSWYKHSTQMSRTPKP